MRKRRIKRVLYTTLAWILVGVFIALYDHLTYLMFEADLAGYSLGISLQTNILGALIGGSAAIGISELYLKPTGTARSFLHSVFLHSLVYSTLILAMTVILTFVFQAQLLQQPIFSRTVSEASAYYLLGAGPIKFLLVWGLVGVITAVIHEVSDYFGPGFYGAFLMGRYHHPKVESRTFMFLDLVGSTAIAEKLGHVRYFELIQRFFADVTEPIINHGGQIYQYVGDEVIVTWVGETAFEDDACIHCYFAIQDQIEGRRKKYQTRFGVIPEFRAGLHCGEVTTGEVGLLRKDIVHSGDVLNTTARIQGKCKDFGVDLLISAAVRRRADPSQWSLKSLGELVLRGRERKLELIRVERAR